MPIYAAPIRECHVNPLARDGLVYHVPSGELVRFDVPYSRTFRRPGRPGRELRGGASDAGPKCGSAYATRGHWVRKSGTRHQRERRGAHE